MLKKKNRLDKFNFSKGTFFKSESFNLKFWEGTQKDPKFAFVISKKLSKSAVERNKTKRILSKILEENLGKVKENMNVVIIAKKLITKKEAEKNILESMKKAKITE